MGQMKWVYSLAQDGRLEEYMEVYYKNLANNCAGFTYDGKFLTMVRATAVLKLLKDADKEYQEHIDQQAEKLASEWEKEGVYLALEYPGSEDDSQYLEQ